MCATFRPPFSQIVAEQEGPIMALTVTWPLIHAHSSVFHPRVTHKSALPNRSLTPWCDVVSIIVKNVSHCIDKCRYIQIKILVHHTSITIPSLPWPISARIHCLASRSFCQYFSTFLHFPWALKVGLSSLAPTKCILLSILLFIHFPLHCLDLQFYLFAIFVNNPQVPSICPLSKKKKKNNSRRV